MASQVVVRRVGKFKNEIQVGEHRLLADEPRDAGGEGQGPDPYGFLLAALGACISMTLTLYADRKQWPLEGVEVRLSHGKVYSEDCAECEEDDDARLDIIRANVVIRGHFDDAQKKRLTEVVGRCPVHRTLAGGPKMFETVSFEDPAG